MTTEIPMMLVVLVSAVLLSARAALLVVVQKATAAAAAELLCGVTEQPRVVHGRFRALIRTWSRVPSTSCRSGQTVSASDESHRGGRGQSRWRRHTGGRNGGSAGM